MRRGWGTRGRPRPLGSDRQRVLGPGCRWLQQWARLRLRELDADRRSQPEKKGSCSGLVSISGLRGEHRAEGGTHEIRKTTRFARRAVPCGGGSRTRGGGYDDGGGVVRWRRERG